MGLVIEMRQGKLIHVFRQTHPLYTSEHTGSVSAHVWDLAGPELPPGVDPETVDVVVMVFVLSALHPKEWTQAIGNVHRVSWFQTSHQLLTCLGP